MLCWWRLATGLTCPGVGQDLSECVLDRTQFAIYFGFESRLVRFDLLKSLF